MAKQKTVSDKFHFGPWKLKATKSHILNSEGPERERFESVLRLPHLPEMVFADNLLELEHDGGFGIRYNAMDALMRVDAEHDSIKVADARQWQEARADSEHITNVVNPFDWTYTTDYTGTVYDTGTRQFKIEETEERIDLEKLKQREKIQFYADILLFEDELHDCGCSFMNVKIRVMPTSFFVLLRFYMRVDNVLIRMNESRVYHEAEWNYILRENTEKESRIESLNLPQHKLIDPAEVCDHLEVKKQIFEKLTFP